MYWPNKDYDSCSFYYLQSEIMREYECIWAHPIGAPTFPIPIKLKLVFCFFIGMNINLQPLVNNWTCCLKYVDIISVLYKICQRRDKRCALHVFLFQNCVEIVITVITIDHIPYCSCRRVAGTINTTFIIIEYHYWFRELCNILFFKYYIYYTIKVGSSGAQTVETGFCRSVGEKLVVLTT